MKSKTLQYFSNDYLQASKQLTPEQILQFLEDFRVLHGSKQVKTKSKLISLKIPPNLLNAFKTKAALEGIPYQTMIKKLMKDWLQI